MIGGLDASLEFTSSEALFSKKQQWCEQPALNLPEPLLWFAAASVNRGTATAGAGASAASGTSTSGLSKAHAARSRQLYVIGGMSPDGQLSDRIWCFDLAHRHCSRTYSGASVSLSRADTTTQCSSTSRQTSLESSAFALPDDCGELVKPRLTQTSSNMIPGQWKCVGRMPFPRVQHAAIAIGSNIFVFGGLWRSPASASALSGGNRSQLNRPVQHLVDNMGVGLLAEDELAGNQVVDEERDAKARALFAALSLCDSIDCFDLDSRSWRTVGCCALPRRFSQLFLSDASMPSEGSLAEEAASGERSASASDLSIFEVGGLIQSDEVPSAIECYALERDGLVHYTGEQLVLPAHALGGGRIPAHLRGAYARGILYLLDALSGRMWALDPQRRTCRALAASVSPRLFAGFEVLDGAPHLVGGLVAAASAGDSTAQPLPPLPVALRNAFLPPAVAPNSEVAKLWRSRSRANSATEAEREQDAGTSEECELHVERFVLTDRVERYDAESDSWALIPLLLRERAFHAVLLLPP